MTTQSRPVNLDYLNLLRGGCTRTNCTCSQYYWQACSNGCGTRGCGHAGSLHAEIGRRVCMRIGDNLSCECRGFREVPNSNDCYSCAHPRSEHLERPGQRDSEAGTSGVANLLAASADTTRVYRREDNTDDQWKIASDEAKQIRRGSLADAQDRRAWGGKRTGSGRRKKTDPEDETLDLRVLPIKSTWPRFKVIGRVKQVNCNLPIDLSWLKEWARQSFSNSSAYLPWQLDAEGEELFLSLDGTPATTTNVKKTRGRLYYYNPKFDEAVVATSQKQREPGGDDALSIDSDSDDVQRESGGDTIPKSHAASDAAAQQPDGSELQSLARRRARSVLQELGPAALPPNPPPPPPAGSRSPSGLVIDTGNTSFPMGTGCEETDEGAVDKNAVAEAFQITRGGVHLIMEYCKAGESHFLDLLQQLNANEWTASTILPVFDKYLGSVGKGLSTFSVMIDRRREEDESDAEYRKRIQKVLLRTFKQDPRRLGWKAEVSFDEEQGVGDGLLGEYIEMLRCFVIAPYFEGNEDRQLPKKNSKYTNAEWAFVGQTMGHIAIQGRVVIPGMSDLVKRRLIGLDTSHANVVIEDVPDFDLQCSLRKLLEDHASYESLTQEDKVTLSLEIKELEHDDAEVVFWNGANQLWEIKQGREEEVAQAIIKNTVNLQRTRQLTALHDSFNDICPLEAFSQLFGGKCDSILPVLFPSLASTVIGRNVLKEMLVYADQLPELDVEKRGELTSQLKSCVDSWVDSLEEGLNDNRSTARFIRLSTGDKYLSASHRITVMLVSSGNGIEAHTCTRRIDVPVNVLEDVQSAGDTKSLFVTAFNFWMEHDNTFSGI